VFQIIKCVKILTFPVYLAARHAMFQSASKFSIRISENPHSPCQKGIAEKSKALLAEVVYKRIQKRELIKEDAIQTAVEFSGGNLRFLMDILQKASRNAIHLDGEKAKNTMIMKTEVESAVSELAELPSLSVMRRVRVLKYVLDRKQEPEDEAMQKDFIDSVLDNSIYAYFNGHPWYEVNPVIKDSVAVYSKKSGPFPL
jgi:hypothetical protein